MIITQPEGVYLSYVSSMQWVCAILSFVSCLAVQ